MGEFSLSHILILTLILLIFFGPSRLPQLGQSLGKAIRGFKEGLNEINADAKDVGPQNNHVQPSPQQPAQPAAQQTAQNSEAGEKTRQNS